MHLRSVLIAATMAVSLALVPQTTFARGGPESVAGLARTLSPAVVNISTTRRVPGGVGEPFPRAPEGSPLDDRLDELNPNREGGRRMMEEAESLGSGFVVSAEGHIVTNHHVIDGADQILIYFQNGTRLPARIIGLDQRTDLAVLKVDAPGPLTFVEFGDSDAAEVGDWVMAIGNPFGLGGSVTLGIISARNRDIRSGPYDDFIQTDASINQGNSGGPLLDMDGDVIGINTAIIARGGSSLGIGFAVPANMASRVVAQLVEYGEVRRGWIGVNIEEVTDDVAASLGRPNTDGALVNSVTEKGPSEGVLQAGDVILEFDGRRVARMRDLPRFVSETPEGSEVPVRLLRGGEEVTVALTTGRLDTGEPAITIEPARADEPVDDPIPPLSTTLPGMLGFELEPLTDARRREFAMRHQQSGVVVTNVNPASDAWEKGILAGLVIDEVNQKKVSTIADVSSLVGAARDAGRMAVLFKVTNQSGESRFVAVRLQ